LDSSFEAFTPMIFRVLSCDAVKFCGTKPKFQRSVLPPSLKSSYPTMTIHGVTTQKIL